MYGNNSRMDGNAMDEPGWPGDASRIEEGAEIGAFHMWKFAGFDDKGDFLLYNKDGEVIPASQKSVDDKQYIGNYLPKVMMGWNNTFTYKNFDLGINMRSWIGFDVLNTYPMYLGIQGQSGAGQWNLWKPALDDPKYKDIRGVKQRPVDILVGTKSRFDERKNQFTVENEVFHKGVLLYGSAS